MDPAESLRHLYNQYLNQEVLVTPRRIQQAGNGNENEFEILEPLYPPTTQDLFAKGDLPPIVIFID